MKKDNIGRITQLEIGDNITQGSSICATCGKNMPNVWDTVCSECGKASCYKHSYEKDGKWFCGDCK